MLVQKSDLDALLGGLLVASLDIGQQLFNSSLVSLAESDSDLGLQKTEESLKDAKRIRLDELVQSILHRGSVNSYELIHT